MFDATDMHHDAPLPGRTLPHSIEAEMALLGAILVNPCAYERVADFLRPEHFALAEHRPIYDGICRLADQGRLADVVTMKSYLDNAGALDQVGGPEYLNRLVDCAVTPTNASEYGRLIHELAVRRETIAKAEDVLNRAFDGTDDLREAVDALRSTAEKMSIGDSSGGLSVLAPGELGLVKESWLVKDLIPRVGTAVAFGPSGSGKSFIVLGLAMSISRGDDWRGRKTEPGAVLYLSPDGGGLFTNRILAYCQHNGIAPDDHAVFTATCGIDLLATGDGCDTDKVLRTIEQIEKAHGVSVAAVVVDTASRAMPGGDENAAKDMTRLIDNLSRIGAGKRAVIAVHHSGKDPGQGMRGHSAFYAAADCVLKVHDGQIWNGKSRDGASSLVGGFRLQQVEIGTDDDGDAITSCVVVEADGTGRVPRDGLGQMSPSRSLALRTVENLIAQHGEPLPCGGGFPSSQHHGVPARLVLETLKGSILQDCEAQAARKRWERLRDWLHDKGAIGVCNGWVWIPRGSTSDSRNRDGQTVPRDASQAVPRDGTGRSVYRPSHPSRPSRPDGSHPPASAPATTSDSTATCRSVPPYGQPADDGEDWIFPKESVH